MTALKDLPFDSNGGTIRVTGELDTVTDAFAELQVSVVPSAAPLVPRWAISYGRRADAEVHGTPYDYDYVTCTNMLPMHLRAELGTSNRCGAQIPLVDGMELRFIVCPSCQQPLPGLTGGW